ncbi:cysteine protease [Coemansia sp. RSA 1933]|nr:cysteine protease [Coemansia sp. RSA 1933]
MTTVATAVVAAMCALIGILCLSVFIRLYVVQRRPLPCVFPVLWRRHRRGRRYKWSEERLKKYEEVQQLSLDETLARLNGTRAMRNHVYAGEYAATHFIDESEGGLNGADTEAVIEHGANAWEFVPAQANGGVDVHNRTEIDFGDGEHSLVANMQMPNEQRVYYFEVRLDRLPRDTNVALGVAMRDYPPLRMAGWAPNSIALHTLDGCIYHCHPLDVCKQVDMSPHTSDTLGVGWRPNSGKVFFTVNGAIVCHLRTAWAHKRMYPIVSADGPCSLNVNVGARAFVLAHANMRHWGLAPPEGARPPPPLYQNVSETVLLAAHSHSLDGSVHSASALPPSYEDSSHHHHTPPAHAVLDLDLDLDLDDLDLESNNDNDRWSRFSAAIADGSSSSGDRMERIMSTLNGPLYLKTTELIRKAVDADAQCQYSEALGLYNEVLKSIAALLDEQEYDKQHNALSSKYCEYACRVGQLLRMQSTNASYNSNLDAAHDALAKARRLHTQNHDSSNAAMEFYVSGISRYQRILRREKTMHASQTSNGARASSDWYRELCKYAALCLSEAENAKKAQKSSAEAFAPEIASVRLNGKDASDLGSSTSTDSKSNNSSSSGSSVGGRDVRGSPGSPLSAIANISELRLSSSPKYPSEDRLSPDEVQVVRTTSHINGLMFLPWLDNDVDENFALHDNFTDKDGLPTLSPKQQRKLWKWRRAGQLYSKPQIFGQSGCAHIVQETVTDCSFVAALCVSIEYENRFHRQLITRHIYPRSSTGAPAFNPSGKYMVKLFVNGLWRRVVIDDLLPVADDGRLICTYSTAGDIGQSLIEKAFLKVMGGYDFPGSNSSTDLHALTGWIPEHVFIQDQSFDEEHMWERMFKGLHDGNALITIATGKMGSDVAGALGLVPSHAYAVLDLREVCGFRLLKVKNPWSMMRWTGKFSHLDRAAWTPELMDRLDYDPATAENNDLGVFWIDYESVCHRFDAIHLNWNPALFAHRASAHFAWGMDMGPRQALYDFSSNPQYTLDIAGDPAAHGSSPGQSSLVWILLSKHVLKTEENRDYIALHVYDQNSGGRIYEPQTALHIGAYVNTPHVLVQLSAVQGRGYTVVVAQREKTQALYFTLRVFCESPLRLERAPIPEFQQTIQDQWRSSSAGGNTALPRYLDNPQYRLDVKRSGSAPISGTVTLEAVQKYPINVRIFRGGYLVTRVLEVNTVANSGKYRSRFCTCALENIDEGSYTVVASTFEPFMFSHFKLTVGMGQPFTLTPIAREGAGMRLREMHGRWMPGTEGSMGGPVDRFYSRNPRFLVRVDTRTRILVRLQTPRAESLPLINVSVFAFDNTALGPVQASSGSYTNSPQGVATQPTFIGDSNRPTEHLVVVSTWDEDADASFVLYFYSEDPADITAIPF